MRFFFLLFLLAFLNSMPTAQAEWRTAPAPDRAARSMQRTSFKSPLSINRQAEIKPYYAFLLTAIGIALLITAFAFFLINVSLVIGLMISILLGIGFLGALFGGDFLSALGFLACFSVAIITTISVRANPWSGIVIALSILFILIMSLIFTAPFR